MRSAEGRVEDSSAGGRDENNNAPEGARDQGRAGEREGENDELTWRIRTCSSGLTTNSVN
jgi:hypothetical protein